MRVLLIKTSSMGDVIHTLPALTDAGFALPGISFDWVVEESFAEIPRWHPLVAEVIPMSLRRWRKNIFSTEARAGWLSLRKKLHREKYDLVLDAQGLLKSAFLTCFTQGVRAGLDFRSARESLASVFYQRKHTVNFYQHAIVRMRSLFQQALGYAKQDTAPQFGLDRQVIDEQVAFQVDPREKYLVFLHGTTWATKQWPETYWLQLSHLAAALGYRIKIGGGNPEEVARANRLAAQNSAIDVLPYLSISSMAKLLVHAQAAVAVDTGFGHLAAALSVPTVSLYSSTNPDYTGALGCASVLLKADFSCAPCLSRACTYREVKAVTPACFTELPPAKVWETLQALLKARNV